VTGVDANPEAHDHARLRYRQPNLHFECGLVEVFGEPASHDAVVFLQTIEHLGEPLAVLRHLRRLLAPGGVAYVSTPNVLTLAPPGAAHSGNPWHRTEYHHEEFLALCEAAFPSVALLGLHHARKLRLHALALQLGWDRIHRWLHITAPFYERFTRAISTRDFELRPERLERALDFIAVCKAP
jgi:2-polyprenyl-3-methyl-5-hydroxy-6-metoxy-1,4-benzoquinol methylase